MLLEASFGSGEDTAIRPGPSRPASWKERSRSLGTILIIVLILVLIGVLPTWPHSREWGYAPSGLLGTVLLILVVLFLLGRL